MHIQTLLPCEQLHEVLTFVSDPAPDTIPQIPSNKATAWLRGLVIGYLTSRSSKVSGSRAARLCNDLNAIAYLLGVMHGEVTLSFLCNEQWMSTYRYKYCDSCQPV